MAKRIPPQVADHAVVLWRDSHRAQFWALFFVAIWMLLYLGQAIPIWVVGVGILFTMAIIVALIVKFRPRQAAAWVEEDHVTTPRLFLPPRRWPLEQPAQVSALGDEENMLLEFKPQQRRLRKVVFWREANTLADLEKLGVQVRE